MVMFLGWRPLIPIKLRKLISVFVYRISKMMIALLVARIQIPMLGI